MIEFPFSGVIANVFTVFHDDLSLDDDGQRRFLDALSATESVSAYFVRSGMGQMYSFAADDVKQMARTACSHLGVGAPVLVGAAGAWDRNQDQRPDPEAFIQESIELSRFAEDVGAAGVVHTLPEAILVTGKNAAADIALDYFSRIAGAVSIPVLIYQAPGTDELHCVTPESLARIAAIDGVRGIKISSPDAGYMFDLCGAIEGTDCAFITGNECSWLWGLHCGSPSVIGQGACVNPQVLKAVQDRFDNGDLVGAREAQASINLLVEACPNAVDFYKRYLNENGYAMSAALRPVGNNPYAEADRVPLTEAEYAAFKRVYETELARYSV
jgi:4-hydroxy-tetrahydrodipicolinate synthase